VVKIAKVIAVTAFSECADRVSECAEVLSPIGIQQAARSE
jgi:hypothetical protein